MPYEIGDPNHIHVHNQLITDVQGMADQMAVEVVLPDPANLGDLGHTSDHNLIVTAIQKIADEGGLSWAVVTGGTVTEYTHPEYGVMEVHTFTANGSLDVVTPGYAECLVVGAGASGYNDGSVTGGGGGGQMEDGLRSLSAGTLAVTVGVTGGHAAAGTDTKLGTLVAPGGRQPTVGSGGQGAGGSNTGTTGGPGRISTITGISVEHSRGGNSTTPMTTPVAGQYGWGASSPGVGTPGTPSAGVVIVAVPKPVA